VVERIISEIASGATLRRLAARLDAEVVPTPNGGVRWQPAVLREMCCNPAYTGAAYANRRIITKKNGTRVQRERPLDEQIPLPAGTVPAIVSSECAAAAQERLRNNKSQARRNNHRPEAFLLRGGFVVGGCCGKRLYTEWVSDYAFQRRQGEKRAMYRVRRDTDGHNDCPNMHITAATLDDAVWRRIRALFLQPEIIEREVERLRTEDPTIADRSTVERSLAAVTQQQTNLTRAVAALADPDASAPLLEAMKATGVRKRALEAERNALEERHEVWAATQIEVGPLAPWIARVAANLDTMTYEEKRNLLTLLRVQVTVFPKDHTPRYEIRAAVPLPQDSNDIVYSTH
jgi:hypothetical protein